MFDETLLVKLADEFVQKARQAKLPDIEEYAVKHPELADRVRELFPAYFHKKGL